MQKPCVSIVVRLFVSIVAQTEKILSTVIVIRVPNASDFAFGLSVELDRTNNDRFPARAFQIDHLPLTVSSQFIKKKIRLADVCARAGVALKFG
jgi:hypothetical protein